MGLPGSFGRQEDRWNNGMSPRAARRLVWLYWDQEPGYSRPGRKPACSRVRRSWQAVTPEPQ